MLSSGHIQAVKSSLPQLAVGKVVSPVCMGLTKLAGSSVTLPSLWHAVFFKKIWNDLGSNVHGRCGGRTRKMVKFPIHFCPFHTPAMCVIIFHVNGRYPSETTSRLQHLCCHANYYSSLLYHHLLSAAVLCYHFHFSCSQVCDVALTASCNMLVLGCLRFLVVRQLCFFSGTTSLCGQEEIFPNFLLLLVFVEN